jgi:hypothetical protein
MPEKKTLDVGSCRSLYDKTTDAVKVSDIMVRGNSIGAQ